MNVLRILRHPRAAVVAHDLVMVAVSWLAAGWIIHRGVFPGISFSLSQLSELLLVLAVQGLVLWSTGLYKGLWRFASFPDLWNIARGALFGMILIIVSLTILRGAEVRQVLGTVLAYPAILFLGPWVCPECATASGKILTCRAPSRAVVCSASWCLGQEGRVRCWRENCATGAVSMSSASWMITTG